MDHIFQQLWQLPCFYSHPKSLNIDLPKPDFMPVVVWMSLSIHASGKLMSLYNHCETTAYRAPLDESHSLTTQTRRKVRQRRKEISWDKHRDKNSTIPSQGSPGEAICICLWSINAPLGKCGACPLKNAHWFVLFKATKKGTPQQLGVKPPIIWGHCIAWQWSWLLY